jgi:hypothetical protein
MTDKELDNVAKIIAIARMNSPACKECRTRTWCPFAYDCLTNEYKWFRERAAAAPTSAVGLTPGNLNRAAANFFKKLFKST